MVSCVVSCGFVRGSVVWCGVVVSGRGTGEKHWYEKVAWVSIMWYVVMWYGRCAVER